MEEKAKKLNDEAVQRYQRGEYPAATKLLREVLALRQALYPKAQYPLGHADLASSLNNLGLLLQAQDSF
jgi:hypothetical protein